MIPFKEKEIPVFQHYYIALCSTGCYPHSDCSNLHLIERKKVSTIHQSCDYNLQNDLRVRCVSD